MNLPEAITIAGATRDLFAPFCERIEVAGSVRRGRPVCNDVDLVCIPKFRVERDFFGVLVARENLLRSALVNYVKDFGPAVSWANGVEPKGDGEIFSMVGRKCQVDFFCASAESWATVLICRTGSKEHNVWISERAASRGGAFRPTRGLWLPDRGLIQARSEEEFYAALELPFIEPHLREWNQLARIAMEVSCP
jgi:DNA polymerase/3'-5' exonuclease PolX